MALRGRGHGAVRDFQFQVYGDGPARDDAESAVQV